MTWRDRRMTLTLDGSAHKQDRAFGVYLAFATGANLLWEVLQLPLYTLWTTGSVREQVFAIAHCTAGDVLISTAALVAALLVFGDRRWPHKHFGRVAAATITIGAGYTIYSEWLNTYVLANWSYADRMPIVPLTGTGLAPLLQWFVVPTLALMAARRSTQPFVQG